MKKLYREGLTAEQASTLVVQALYDAADDDSATGGPDLTRKIFPLVSLITEDGFRRLTDAEVAEIAVSITDERLVHPNGPQAPLL